MAAHQEFRFAGTAEHGEFVPGRPRGPITDEWLEATAAAEGVTVKALRAELAAYKRVDGKPLYPAVGHAPAEEPEPDRAEKPKVPLGPRPAGGTGG
jgi:hypothetical protein